jgi:hypothetical protein
VHEIDTGLQCPQTGFSRPFRSCADETVIDAGNYQQFGADSGGLKTGFHDARLLRRDNAVVLAMDQQKRRVCWIDLSRGTGCANVNFGAHIAVASNVLRNDAFVARQVRHNRAEIEYAVPDGHTLDTSGLIGIVRFEPVSCGRLVDKVTTGGSNQRR